MFYFIFSFIKGRKLSLKVGDIDIIPILSTVEVLVEGWMLVSFVLSNLWPLIVLIMIFIIIYKLNSLKK